MARHPQRRTRLQHGFSTRRDPFSGQAKEPEIREEVWPAFENVSHQFVCGCRNDSAGGQDGRDRLGSHSAIIAGTEVSYLMELIIELRGLQSPNWFEDLTRRMGANPDLAHVQLFEVPQAPGTFGASRKAKVKAHFSAKDVLSTAAELAGIISLVVTLYTGSATPSQSCQIRFATDSTQVEMVVPCKEAASPEFVTTVTDALAKFSGETPKIDVVPIAP